MTETEPLADGPSRDMISMAYLVAALRDPRRLPTERDVADEYLAIERAIGPRSIAARIAGAARIVGEVVEKPYIEESSRRYVLRFRARGQDRTEAIRSDRTDGVNGGCVDSMFRDLKAGDKVIVFKINERADASARMGSGYRICPYIVKLG